MIQQTNRGRQGVIPPVAFIGVYNPSEKIPELISVGGNKSSFGHPLYHYYFMRTLGFDYARPDDTQRAHALLAAEEMPAYPDPGCVKSLEDVVVVKLPDKLEE